jgi:hypothetical protein
MYRRPRPGQEEHFVTHRGPDRKRKHLQPRLVAKWSSFAAQGA